MFPLPIVSNTSARKRIVPKKIAQGSNHLLVLSDKGDVYGIGSNANGELGVPDIASTTSFIKIMSSVKDIFCGTLCSFLLMNDGTLLHSGSRTGIGLSGYNNGFVNYSGFSTPIANNIVQVSSHINNTAILCANGDLYAAGKYWLGDGVFRSSPISTFIRTNTNVRDIVVQDETMYCASTNNVLYGIGNSWGLNQAYTQPDRVSWSYQYDLATPDISIPLGSVFRGVIYKFTNKFPYCIGQAISGQLGNNDTTSGQGNRVYPANCYLAKYVYCISLSTIIAYDQGMAISFLGCEDGIYVSGRGLNYSSGLGAYNKMVGQYTKILDFIDPSTYNPTLVKNITIGLECNHILYGTNIYCAGNGYDGNTYRQFSAMPLPFESGR